MATPAPRLQLRQGSPTTGSATQTEQAANPAAAVRELPPVLTLRGAPLEYRPCVRWAEDVVDNEGLGRKSSKVCCIYHAPRDPGDSSSESSSDSSSSDEDSEEDNSAARPVGGRRGGRRGHRQRHNHDHDHPEGGPGADDANEKGKGKQRSRSPNAYEKMPKHTRNVPPKEGNS